MRYSGIFLGLLAGLMASSAGAQEWQARKSGSSTGAVITKAGSGALVVECMKANRRLSLTYHPPNGWDGNKPAIVSIDKVRFPVVVDGGNGALLSDAPGGQMGLSDKLLNGFKTGKSVMIEGAAAAGIEVGKRTFTLAGAPAAIAAVEQSCR